MATATKQYRITTLEPVDAEFYKRNGRSVQFVKGTALIDDDLASAIGFPEVPARGNDEEPPYGPAESLARKLVSDYGYECDPPLRRSVEPRRARDYFRDGTANAEPLPAGVAAGADAVIAITRIEDTNDQPVIRRVRRDQT